MLSLLQLFNEEELQSSILSRLLSGLAKYISCLLQLFLIKSTQTLQAFRTWFGLGTTKYDELVSALQTKFFSMNIAEATSDNEKVLTIIL